MSQDDFSLEAQKAPAPGAKPAPRKRRVQAAAKGATDDEAQILSYRHPDKRKNNPDVGMVKPENDPEQPKTTWAYDPHLDPALQFDAGRAALEKLIDDALASGDDAAKRAALDAWVKGVNAKGGFGVWCGDVAFQPAQIHDLIEKHGVA